MRALALAAPLLFAGCSLVLDPSRHQGGDGGADPCDVDRDGFPSISCQGGTDCDDHDATRYPGAPAICGDGVANACAGSFPFTSSQLFGGLGDLGTIPATTLRDGGTLGEGVALAAVRVGGSGYGTAGVYTLDLRGDTVLHPLRIDVPLDAPATAVDPAAMGAWVSYALGSLNQNLPTFVVLPDSRGFAPNGPGNWTCGFLPAAHQGTLIRASSPNPIYDLYPPQNAGFITKESDAEGLRVLEKLNREHLAAHEGDQLAAVPGLESFGDGVKKQF